jgi:DNA polymerase V
MFILADCNSFYASCERVFRPDLAQRPVAVLSNNDGCIIAESREARELGLVMGSPYYQAAAFCKKHDVAVFSSNYALYGDLSRRVMATLAGFSPRLEMYSIDEAFLEVESMPDAAGEAFCLDIAKTVKRWTGIPVSLGFASTKTLAKAANRRAKALRRPAHVLTTPEAVNAVLTELPADGVWGVSSGFAARLSGLGVSTGLELKNLSISLARKRFGVTMERIIRELRGEVCLELEQEPPPKKQIHVSRSFGERVTSLESLEEAIATYAARVGEKLRRQESVASGLYVYIRTNPFRRDEPQYSNGIALPLVPATAHSGELIAKGLEGLRRIYRRSFCYKKAGVMALDLVGAKTAERSLFSSPEERARGNRLMQALDKVNRRYGADSLYYAGQGLPGRSWRMRRELLSPLYTTRWEDLPVVH